MLCVIAKIDPKSKARFLKLQEKIEKLGVSVKALHGHITLVSYIGEDEVRKFFKDGYLLRSLEALVLPEDLTYTRLSPEQALQGAVEKLAGNESNFAEPRAL